MTDSDLSQLLAGASTRHPTIRWIGVVIDDGTRAAITGIRDGMVATEKTGNVTTVPEAIQYVADRLARMG